jgi:hypothetical protein
MDQDPLREQLLVYHECLADALARCRGLAALSSAAIRASIPRIEVLEDRNEILASFSSSLMRSTAAFRFSTLSHI